MGRGRARIFTAAQRAEMWRRYKAGESILGIGQALDRAQTTVHRELQYTGGIAPSERSRSSRVLSLVEREEVSRGIAGDFGIWPDPGRIDKATRHHDGAGDFPVWLKENRGVPRPTAFIKGNHEDFAWLDAQEKEVLPGLTCLRNGHTIDIRSQGAGSLRVGGVGGCYGPSDYLRRSDRLQGYAKRHYTADEIERLADPSSVDIVLTHDAPAGVHFEGHRRRAGYISEAAGLGNENS